MYSHSVLTRARRPWIYTDAACRLTPLWNVKRDARISRFEEWITCMKEILSTLEPRETWASDLSEHRKWTFESIEICICDEMHYLFLSAVALFPRSLTLGELGHCRVTATSLRCEVGATRSSCDSLERIETIKCDRVYRAFECIEGMMAVPAYSSTSVWSSRVALFNHDECYRRCIRACRECRNERRVSCYVN